MPLGRGFATLIRAAVLGARPRAEVVDALSGEIDNDNRAMVSASKLVLFVN